MIDNFYLIKQRISSYTCVPDRSFKTSMGYSVFEEGVAQKLRQYWADKSIPNSEKLKDFDYDLSDFDPENTSCDELEKIVEAMFESGMIDRSTSSLLTQPAWDFNSMGNQINKDKKVNVVEGIRRNLEVIKGYVAEGRGYAKDTLTCLNMNITVILALKERAEMMRANSIVDVKI